MRVVSVPVVMRADMIIAGDQPRWNDLTYDTGDHAAMMSIPGADRSGCKFRDRFQLRHQEFPLDHRSKK